MVTDFDSFKDEKAKLKSALQVLRNVKNDCASQMMSLIVKFYNETARIKKKKIL